MLRTIATTSGRAFISDSVASVSVATGFQHKLLIILAQIQARMSGTTGASSPAPFSAAASRSTRSLLEPSGSPIGKRDRLPSWWITPGAVTSDATQ